MARGPVGKEHIAMGQGMDRRPGSDVASTTVCCMTERGRKDALDPPGLRHHDALLGTNGSRSLGRACLERQTHGHHPSTGFQSSLPVHAPLRVHQAVACATVSSDHGNRPTPLWNRAAALPSSLTYKRHHGCLTTWFEPWLLMLGVSYFKSAIML